MSLMMRAWKPEILSFSFLQIFYTYGGNLYYFLMR